MVGFLLAAAAAVTLTLWLRGALSEQPAEQGAISSAVDPAPPQAATAPAPSPEPLAADAAVDASVDAVVDAAAREVVPPPAGWPGHRWSEGTFLMTRSTCIPHPAQVVFPQMEQVTA